jgi:hypothetical protein
VVTVMTLVLLVAALVVVGLVIVLTQCGQSAPPDRRTYETLVELHRIRRRFDVAQLKSELRRDGADARRVLRAELDELDDES